MDNRAAARRNLRSFVGRLQDFPLTLRCHLWFIVYL